MNYNDLAEKALQGLPLDREQCQTVLRCSQDNILELLQAAFRVREKHFGKRVIVQLLINAKSGLCSEDCAYCSQSAASQATIEKYPLLDEEKIVGGAFAATGDRVGRGCRAGPAIACGSSDLASPL